MTMYFDEDLVEAMDAMREMLTQGDHKAELELELAEVNHKLDKISGPSAPPIGEDEYTFLGLLHALKNNLEERLHKLEDIDKEPQEANAEDFLEEILDKINAKTQVEIHKLYNNNIGW